MRCRSKGARVRRIVRVLADVEMMKRELTIESSIDWSDEEHRVT